jgi:hypothetical protein
MQDVTESWHTFTEAEGAEYMASYVAIWRCPRCSTVVGAHDETVEWVMRPEGALNQE